MRSMMKQMEKKDDDLQEMNETSIELKKENDKLLRKVYRRDNTIEELQGIIDNLKIEIKTTSSTTRRLTSMTKTRVVTEDVQEDVHDEGDQSSSHQTSRQTSRQTSPQTSPQTKCKKNETKDRIKEKSIIRSRSRTERTESIYSDWDDNEDDDNDDDENRKKGFDQRYLGNTQDREMNNQYRSKLNDFLKEEKKVSQNPSNGSRMVTTTLTPRNDENFQRDDNKNKNMNMNSSMEDHESYIKQMREPQKRRSQSIHTDHQRSKRARITQQYTLFVGDDQLQMMAKDDRLLTAAFRCNWDIEFKRGGYIKDIRQIIKSKLEEEEKSTQLEFNRIVISVGSMDFVNRESHENISDQLDSLVELIKTKKKDVVLLVPPPRIEISHNDLRRMQNVFHDLGAKHKIKVIQTWSSRNVDDYRDKMWDEKKHLSKNQLLDILQKTCMVTNSPLDLYDLKVLTKEQILGRVCFTCGYAGREGYEHTCQVYGCSICDSSEHNSKVCLFKTYRRCYHCGATGHMNRNCFRNKKHNFRR